MADGVVYAIIHPLTREIQYVGQTIDFSRRKRRHLTQANHPNTPVHNWIQKLQREGFSPEFQVLETAPINQLDSLESFYILYFKGQGCDLKNLTDGGDGVRGYRWSSDARERQSLALKTAWADPQKARRISDAQRASLDESWRLKNSEAQSKIQRFIQSDPEINRRRAASVSATILAKKIQFHRWEDDGGR